VTAPARGPTPDAPAPAAPPQPRKEHRYRAADQIVEILYKQGIRTVFGLPGGSISPIYDALLDRPEIRVVSCKHENMAVFAAAAYARATDSVGVVLVTSGPGVTNCLTGLASAFCDSMPVLILAGEVPRAQFGRGALQEGSPYSLDVRSMVQRITKSATELTNSQSAGTLLGKALLMARSGRRGPVFLSLPMDLVRGPVSPPRIAAHVSSQFTVEAPLLDEVADLLAGAERPLLMAGSGARWGDGPTQLLRLAERGGLPVITTPKAKGVFPESHKLALGVYGHGGHPSASSYLEGGIDVLFAVGTGLGDAATNSWNQHIKASRAFIQLDVDAAQIGRNYRADIGLVGPAEVLMRQLLERLPKNRRLSPVRHVERFSDASLSVGRPSEAIKPQRAIWELQEALPADTIFTVDIGEHMLFALHYLQLELPDCFYFAGGLGSMASGLGAAFGVKLAKPERPVVCICGDGTLSMSGTEILTAVQEQLPIIFAVFNDGRYGMVDNGFNAVFGRTRGFGLQPLSVSGLAESLGARAIPVNHAGDILSLDFAGIQAERRPVVLDIAIDPNEAMPHSDRLNSLAASTGDK
jgi:acetolactate synthase-1/2/3 large subunit